MYAVLFTVLTTYFAIVSFPVYFAEPVVTDTGRLKSNNRYRRKEKLVDFFSSII